MSTNIDPLLDDAQVLEILGMEGKEDWLADQRQAGRIGYVRLGRKTVKYKRSQVEQFIANCTVDAA